MASMRKNDELGIGARKILVVKACGISNDYSCAVTLRKCFVRYHFVHRCFVSIPRLCEAACLPPRPTV